MKKVGIFIVMVYVIILTFAILYMHSISIEYSKYSTNDEKKIENGIRIKDIKVFTYETAFYLKTASLGQSIVYILKNTICFSILNFIFSYILWWILHIKYLKEIATRKTLIIMNLIPIIVLFIRLIYLMPRYVVLYH